MSQPYPQLGDVLVLEDNFDTLHHLGERLRDVGYNPILVSRIDDAWDAIRRTKPQALILDVRLGPESEMGGLEVLQRIRQSGNQTPVIIYSAFMQEFQDRARDLGADAVISKADVPQKDITRVIEELLLSRATGAQLLYQGQSDRELLSVTEQIAFVDRRLMEYLASHPSDLRLLDPRQFEEVIAEIWRAAGYEVKLTPRSRDGGKDIYAVINKGFGELLYVIECKKYAVERPVGVEIVRALYGVSEAERATMGLIVTTSYFTAPALDFQKRMAPYRLTLRDFQGVARWLSEYSNR